ncbi:GNAT family N-acetyltransferase [Agrobacterium larrymoorei]|uniref:GNAT family N-acetyltransferase n=1 Tax=Agrobacterium larrymoorei TaxID=160699 RepID=A0A4D7DMM2_9HYPH|nr:GNAT family N-acetyltransferase [Agrobacterium larrymoorei]QCI97328.1 GNAT family N-acetyltransferase [Agrobacterium larrymoorei]QYA07238.1 GNAT family N-acetyltransferase [Agrobacterium larrymoorei]
MHFSIRRAELRDAADIARLHVEVWRQTYRGLVPQDAYAALDESRRHEMWKSKLCATDPHEIALVAESEAQLIGVGAAGPPSDTVFGKRAEIKHLYIHSSAKRRGVGTQILSKLASHMKMCGYGSAALSVVRGNEQAELFYRARKGEIIGEFVDPGPLWRSHNLVYAWDDINELISQ